MGMSIIPGGVLMVREEAMQEHGFTIPYLAGGCVTSLTLTGTRPGAPVLAFLALTEHLGFEGYKKIVKECMANTAFLAGALESIDGLSLAASPEMNVLGIKSAAPASVLNSRLREHGWILGLFAHLDLLRVVLMPHIGRSHLESFVEGLRTLKDV
jgi:tyrosine decarboxylase / aspartate 1-decarboxylase